MFYRLYETPADQGGGEAPVAEAPVVEEAPPVEQDAPEEAPAGITREQLAEALGPHWERYGRDDPIEALRELAKGHENARQLISRGGHLEPQDPDVYAEFGLAPPVFEQEEEEPEYVAPIYGAPWAPPESWDELVDLAQPTRANGMPGNPKAAYEFVANRTDVDDQTKMWFFANFAANDVAGWTAYQQGAVQAATDARVAEIEARIDQRLQPIEQGTMRGNAQNMLSQAAESIPGFYENREAVQALMDEKRERYSNYGEWFFNATIEQQVQEMRDLTGIAIFRAQPEADAEEAEEAAATEQEKVRAKTETGRTAGAPARSQGPQSEMKKKNVQDFKTLKDQGML